MPGFITHLFFGEQTLSFIESKEAISVLEAHKTTFALGLQGPDIFFYHIPAYFFYEKNIGNIIHKKSVMFFFENLINARNTFEDNHERRICDAYILGFIGHYSLDVACHPYIYFKSNHFNNIKRSNAYDFGKHVSLETDIDHVVLQHYKNLNPSQFDYAGSVTPSKNEQRVISLLLQTAINKTFVNNKIYRKTITGAINSFIKLNRAMNDPTGKKKRRVRKIEQIIFKHCVISAMIPSDTKLKYNDPCNEFHNEWENPWYPEIPRTDSIFDLINKTMPLFIGRIELYMKSCGYLSDTENSLDSIEETKTYLHYRNQLLSNLSDLSYLTGLPLEQ